MSDSAEAQSAPQPALSEGHVLRVRLGHGANCSSIGSLVDTMFAVATIGSAVFASVVAAMGTEPVHVAGASRSGEKGAEPAHPPQPAAGAPERGGREPQEPR